MVLVNLMRGERFFLIALVLVNILLVAHFTSPWFLQASSSAVRHLTSPSDSSANDNNSEKLGYVTWLGTTGNDTDAEDVYFIATRILVYQILHAPATKSPRGLPIIVMTTPDITPEKKKRLRDDGATVVEIDFVLEGLDWLKPRRPTWAMIMSKLRAWELTEYSRLLMLDGDTLLRRPLDAVFDEVNATLVPTRDETESERRSDEGPLPARYLLAGGPEVNGDRHHWPPSREHNDFIHPTTCNLGFVLLSPSRELFDHYISILNIKNRFPSATMEQSLLNYAHRAAGGMPWRDLPPTYSIRSPLEEDIVGNVASLHVKWWAKSASYPALEKWYRSVKEEMEAFYDR